MTFVIDLVPHLDGGDRNAWQDDQDVRPLSELGWRQASAIADVLGAEPIAGLYAGPALRCRESLSPLAERLGLEVVVLPGIGETAAWRSPAGWDDEAWTPAFAAGLAIVALDEVRRERGQGRVVACSHGHVIPAIAAYLVAAHGLAGVGQLTHRGQWYRLRYEREVPAIELREADNFPSE